MKNLFVILSLVSLSANARVLCDSNGASSADQNKCADFAKTAGTTASVISLVGSGVLAKSALKDFRAIQGLQDISFSDMANYKSAMAIPLYSNGDAIPHADEINVTKWSQAIYKDLQANPNRGVFVEFLTLEQQKELGQPTRFGAMRRMSEEDLKIAIEKMGKSQAANFEQLIRKVQAQNQDAGAKASKELAERTNDYLKSKIEKNGNVIASNATRVMFFGGKNVDIQAKVAQLFLDLENGHAQVLQLGTVDSADIAKRVKIKAAGSGALMLFAVGTAWYVRAESKAEELVSEHYTPTTQGNIRVSPGVR